MSRARQTPEERARALADAWRGLVWHAWAFVLVNAFLWIQDIVSGGGLEWAYWATIPWGLGLAFHAIAFQIDRRDPEDRKYEQFLREERAREARRREPSN